LKINTPNTYYLNTLWSSNYTSSLNRLSNKLDNFEESFTLTDRIFQGNGISEEYVSICSDNSDSKILTIDVSLDSYTHRVDVRATDNNHFVLYFKEDDLVEFLMEINKDKYSSYSEIIELEQNIKNKYKFLKSINQHYYIRGTGYCLNDKSFKAFVLVDTISKKRYFKYTRDSSYKNFVVENNLLLLEHGEKHFLKLVKSCKNDTNGYDEEYSHERDWCNSIEHFDVNDSSLIDRLIIDSKSESLMVFETKNELFEARR